MKIPVSSPIISDSDLLAVHKAVDKGWFTEGRQCKQFSKELCEYTGNKYCQLVNSGSSANLLAVTTAVEKFPKGKLIITSALGFPTTVAPIYQNNRIPAYVDIDPITLSPDIGQIAYMVDKYGDDIAGAILGHVLGFPYDERVVREILGDKFFIADCCDALGAGIDGWHVGHWADISTYSFFPAHHITTGEGGAVLTMYEELYKVIRSYANWGRDCHCLPGQNNTCGKRFEQNFPTLPEGYDHKYIFTRLGYNLKMTELQAAMGVTQMQNIDDWADIRMANCFDLKVDLGKFSEYMYTAYSEKWSNPSPFGFPVILKIKGYTQDLISHLEAAGIATRRIFAGNITKQPGYTALPYVKLDLDNSDYLMENAFWIGCHPGVTKDMLEYIVETFENWFTKKGLL